MPTCVALLRGINVGGHKPVPMAALRQAFEALGCDAVRSYIQSGNVVFRIADCALPNLGAKAEQQLSQAFGLQIAVVLRTGRELEQTVAAQPFLHVDEAQLAVAFLDGVPTADAVARLDPQRSPPDRFAVVGREIYLHCPNGLGRTKLTLDWFERSLGVKATVRNWRTVQTLEQWTQDA